MKNIYRIERVFAILFIAIATTGMSSAQTLMPLPPHSSVYSGIYARGLWFVAPVDFTITGLMVAPEAGTGLQYIHLMKCDATFPVSSGSASTLFTTLAYISGAPNNTVQAVNIPVQQGDQIGILGTVTGICNSYAPSQIVTTTIGGQQTFLNRLGYQGSIESGPAPNYFGSGNGTSGQIGRIYMYYATASATDAGIDSLIYPGDTICSGQQPVSVLLKNFGPSALIKVDIDWKVNNNIQPSYVWNGNLPVNGIDTVTIGSYSFHHDTTYTIVVNTSEPNNYPDTASYNDTIIKAGIVAKPSPTAIPSSTLYTACPGDTVLIEGTLTGLPPWDLVISDGATNYLISNITTPYFSMTVQPTATTTYSIRDLVDASGCYSSDTVLITVTVVPNPPAVITPMGSLAACYGDSVTLMGSIGLSFSYEWYKNDTLIPGSDSYVLSVKQGGDYKVKVISPNGCTNISAPATVTIHPLPEVFLGKDTALLPVQSILLNAGAGFNSYLWSTGATTQSILVDSAGVGIGVKTIWVHVTDNYYCLGGDTIMINFTNHPGINETFANADIRIIPNPSDGRIELQFTSMPAGQYDIEIFSPDGKAVYRSKHQLNDNKINLDLSHIANGVYLLKVTGSAGTVVERIVIRN